MELVRVRTTSAPGLGLWLNSLRKGLSSQGYRVEVIDNGPVQVLSLIHISEPTRPY